MLHPIPNSPLRNALLKLVEIQQTLMEKLCALPADSIVSLDWLKVDVWPATVDPAWINKFWKNDKINVEVRDKNGIISKQSIGQRQWWMTIIGKADAGAKRELLDLMKEQVRFAELYGGQPTIRLEKSDRTYWEATDFRKAARNLLNDFYAPGLDPAKGCPGAMLECAVTVTRKEYLRGATPTICPYCDTSIQNVEVDHFLPKSSFPFLSVHPDNFIPSCHDSNEFTSHKGDRVPLEWDDADQAATYFHPRLRPAIGRYQLAFRDQGRRLSLSLVAVDRKEQRRVDNLDSMFKITEDFWGKALESKVQDVVDEVADQVRQGDVNADENAVRQYLLGRSLSFRRYIAKRPLHIFLDRLYDFVANDDELVKNAIRLVS